jgi:glycosyltransferase involved in cell wall biosynthesis
MARADLCEPLRWLDKFEVWHFYGTLVADVRTNRLGKRHFRFRNTGHLLYTLLKLKPDVIQGSEPYDFPGGFKLCCVALLASGLLRRPFYFPVFENLPPEVKYRTIKGWAVGGLLAPLLKTFLRLYSRKSLVVFAANRGAVASLLAVGTPPARIRRELYATWGVDLSLFMPDGPRASAIRGTNPILFVGRLVEEKGVRQLLQAFLLVTKRLPDATLAFIGSGPLAGEIAEFASTHSLEGSLALLGQIVNQQLPPYFRTAKVVVAPSLTTTGWSEQVGMVNIQSMACGTPVVSTFSGSIPEFVVDGQTGILVPERDSNALAEAIIRLLTDKHMRLRLSENARAYAVEHYDAPRNVAAVEALLVERLTAVRGSTPC